MSKSLRKSFALDANRLQDPGYGNKYSKKKAARKARREQDSAVRRAMYEGLEFDPRENEHRIEVRKAELGIQDGIQEA